MPRYLSSSIEVLESRIAPSGGLTIATPIPDVTVGSGQTYSLLNLANALQSTPAAFHSNFDTFVDFTTNYMVNGAPGHIVFELYDKEAPLTVQNFLHYVNTPDLAGNYFNTFFHRLAHNQGGTSFVLQGGGYNVLTPGQHITTGPDVHNEFNPADSNLLGTVAMAKTGISPNTATSEFFINLGDNSANLDHQNGGFTVFGKVVSGMNVVDAIAKLNVVNASAATGNSALGTVPYESTLAAGAAPNPGYLVRITGERVVHLDPASTGVTFKVLSVKDSGGNPSDLITTYVSGPHLALVYNPAKDGQAVVTVEANGPNGSFVTASFNVKLQSNLETSSTDTLPALLQGGEAATATATIYNTGGGVANGPVDVNYYLSKINPVNNPNGLKIDANDATLIGHQSTQVNLTTGKSVAITTNVTIPTLLTDMGQYRVVTQITPGSGISDLYTDNYTSLDGTVHQATTKTGSNLVISSTGDTFGELVFPGSAGTETFKILNNAAVPATGNVDVKFYLAKIDPSNPTGATFSPNDILLADKPVALHNLPAGQSVTVTEQSPVPSQLLPVVAGQDGVAYHVVAVMAPDASITDINANGFAAAASATHVGFNAFGTFLSPVSGKLYSNVLLKYQDVNGNNVTMAAAGPEFGEIFTGATASDLTLATGLLLPNLPASYGLNSVVAASAVNGAGQAVHTPIQNIEFFDPLGTAYLQNVDVSGNVDVQGGIVNLRLGDLAPAQGSPNSPLIHLGSTTATAAIRPNLTVGSVTDYNLTADQPVGSIIAKAWLNANPATETIAVPGLTNMFITGGPAVGGAPAVAGNLEANVTVSAANAAFTPAVNIFYVAGTFGHATATIDGNLSYAILGAMDTSNLLVGVQHANGSPALPPAAYSDFAAPAYIGQFTLLGLHSGRPDMAASNVAVAHFGTISSVNVDSLTANEAANFGFIAETIGRYSRDGSHTLINPAPGSYDPAGSYLVDVVPTTAAT